MLETDKAQIVPHWTTHWMIRSLHRNTVFAHGSYERRAVDNGALIRCAKLAKAACHVFDSQILPDYCKTGFDQR